MALLLLFISLKSSSQNPFIIIVQVQQHTVIFTASLLTYGLPLVITLLLFPYKIHKIQIFSCDLISVLYTNYNRIRVYISI